MSKYRVSAAALSAEERAFLRVWRLLGARARRGILRSLAGLYAPAVAKLPVELIATLAPSECVGVALLRRLRPAGRQGVLEELCCVVEMECGGTRDDAQGG